LADTPGIKRGLESPSAWKSPLFTPFQVIISFREFLDDGIARNFQFELQSIAQGLHTNNLPNLC
jgi:hypothetical protein